MRIFVVSRGANGAWHATSPTGGVRSIDGWADLVRARSDWAAVEEWSDELRQQFVDQYGAERRSGTGPTVTSWQV